jgi:hypothetical protein
MPITLYNHLRLIAISFFLFAYSATYCQPSVRIEYESEYAIQDSILINTIFPDEVFGIENDDFVAENAIISLHDVIEYYPTNHTDLYFPDSVITGVKATPKGDVYYVVTKSGSEMSTLFIDRLDGTQEKFEISTLPNGMDIDSNGNIYASTFSTIRVFNETGDLIRSFGSLGSQEGQLNYASRLAMGQGDTLFVVDRNNSRVQAFSTSGDFLFSFGKTFGDIAVDEEGFFYGLYNRRTIEKYNSQGIFIEAIPIPENYYGYAISIKNNIFYVSAYYTTYGNGRYEDDRLVMLDQAGGIINAKIVSDHKFGNTPHIVEINKLSRKAFIVHYNNLKTYNLEYNVRTTLKAIDEGEAKVFLPESVVFDSLGRYNANSDTLLVNFDWTPPTLKLSYLDGSQFILLKAELDQAIRSEYINGRIVGGQSHALEQRSELIFSKYISISIDSGAAKFKIFPNSYFDLAGNGNIVVDSITIYHNLAPLVTSISSEMNQFSTMKDVSIDIRFNKEVEDFSEKDLLIMNGELISFDGSGKNYTAQLKTQYEETVIDILLDSGRVHDSWGQENYATSFFFIIDVSNPNVRFNAPTSTSESVVPISIVFDDPIFYYEADPIFCFAFPSLCFEQEDISIEGGYIKSFSAGQNGVFNIEVVPVNTLVELSIPDSVGYNITDLPNLASKVYQITYANGSPILGVDDEVNLNWSTANQLLDINIIDPTFSNGKMVMIDLNGRMILSKDISSFNSQTDISLIGQGVYILFVQWNDKIFKTKINVD